MDTNNLRILIVEDDLLDAERIELDLTREGYKVVDVVSSAEEFIRKAKEVTIDLAVVDILLSGPVDGINAVKEIRKFNIFPVIYLTVLGSQEFIQRAEKTKPITYLLKPYRRRELLFLIRMAIYRHHQSLKLEAEKKLVESNLWHVATHDLLTDLPNRRLFYDRLDHAFQACKRSKAGMALLYLDVDHFKEINDSYGHKTGDDILKQVTLRLSENIRSSDTIARIGGDEFAIIIENISDRGKISYYVQSLLNIITPPILHSIQEFNLTMSIGISQYDDMVSDTETLIRNADSALYKAKADGRNNFKFYSEDMTRIAIQRVTLESQLQQALKRNEFVLYFQPQIRISDGALCGAEALIRWQHPERGLILPGEFILVAERTGLINAIGLWVLERVCKVVKRWNKIVPDLKPISVNLSGRQLSFGNLSCQYSEVLTKTKCPPKFIELEITEGFLMQDPLKSREELLALKALGVSLAMDDFGTGYSSLSYLKNLPLDKLKIDKSFVHDIPIGESDCAIVKTIINLAKNLSLEIVAEGIENEAQNKWLIQQGCKMGQGYFHSRPMPSEQYEQLITTTKKREAKIN